MKCKEFEFGPWTTSLDAGLRLQLSAFWKQRMKCLTRLPGGDARSGRRALAVTVVAALVVMITPLVELAPRWAHAEEANAKPQAADVKAHAAGDDGAFVAKFSNGVEVELIGLSMNPSKDQPWWRPDGTPLAERPYADVRARMGSGLPREICWRWKNLPDDPDYTISWNTVPGYCCAGGGPVDAEGRRIDGLSAVAVGLSESPDACTVQFSTSVSATPWKTVFSEGGRNYASASSVAGGKPRSVIWSPARKQEGELLITVSFKAPGESVRLVAVDQGEQEHAAVRAYGGGASDFMQQTFAFDDLPLDAVDRFELQTQTREIETIEFVNVSLEPDKRTKVETRKVKADEKTSRN
jgi:hypothetical protein